MTDTIVVRGARVHNLKNITAEIPRGRLVVITGVSGSGKSSLAFDTIYAEGRRRYVESLSAYARQFLDQMEKPDVDSIEGLSPAIAIEQKTVSKNPRSTVGTITEIYDFLRLLFARIGIPHCFQCGGEIAAQTVQQIVDHLAALPQGTRLRIFAPLVRGGKGEYRKELHELKRSGFVRVRIDGVLRDLGEDISLAKSVPHTIEVVVDRLAVREGIEGRLADSLEVAFKYGGELVKVEVGEDGEERLFSQRLACANCGISYPELTPRLFSFNNPSGACQACSGLGMRRYFDPALLVVHPHLSLAGGALAFAGEKVFPRWRSTLAALSRRWGFPPDTPFLRLPEKIQRGLFYGAGTAKGKRGSPATEGLLALLERRYHEAESPEVREELENCMTSCPCTVCHGTRLRKESLWVRIHGKSIAEVSALSIAQAYRFFTSLSLGRQKEEVARPILREIIDRLGFLLEVGVDYLTLDRAAATLSGGEGQRIRLATHMGSHLVGVLYILDEPTIGLHQRDNARLLALLKRLRDLGNTVLVVEHDRETIREADYVIDLGPGAGVHGGEVVATGSPGDVVANPRSLTGGYLCGKLEIPVPFRRTHSKGLLTIRKARHNNLRDVSVQIPLGKITCVTGVSGSGKSSLIVDVLYHGLARRLNGGRGKPGEVEDIVGWQLLDKVIGIDQSPIGRTPRSNPATYTGLFQILRDLFAQLPEARVRGFSPSRFSFNLKGGRCEACRGEGAIAIEMHFLPDIYVTCEVCGGRQYNRETLEVKYKGFSIADVLGMTVTQASELLGNIPPARQKLETLVHVGLEYIRIGQPATTLSGGEAQRIKLAKELSRRSTGRTLYVLDEPTTGLHFHDIKKLLEVLSRLADAGNTVVIIEHNLDVIKTADYIIDLGPEGGDKGGEVVGTGTPEEIAAIPHSHTGKFLRQLLSYQAA